MKWYKKAQYLIGEPVGIALKNGRGTSGILCSLGNTKIFLLEYNNDREFSLKQYYFDDIHNIHPFPPVQHLSFSSKLVH
ncbi:hypothetical protein [Bacillus sp. FJAT-44742]|uniref:hypothetical protein n=1 Tax=Bacillus sp. FJAT-44742 TaxID=2014005 RepID=UPI000C233FC4|nr:hypothetical protein [Bacillus sp. FJAT-44742]